jgi:cytochrome c-type biogenesis protein CcmH/NrfG
MNNSSRHSRAAAALVLTLLVALISLQSGCRSGTQANANTAQAGTATPSASATDNAAPEDVSKLNAEIESLERQVERNPADDDTRGELAKLYVRRGNAQRGAGQLREALADYQSALRLAPDNVEAAANAAAVDQQLGGDQQEDENGAPAPLPITPGVADEDGKSTPTPTPKKP